MKLIFVIVQNDDAKRLMKVLVANNISVTRISSTGGFLHSGNATLMIGVEESLVQKTLDLIKHHTGTRKEYMVIPPALPTYSDVASTPVPITLGGATVFVLDVESSHKF